jgi:hypothetical protein
MQEAIQEVMLEKMQETVQEAIVEGNLEVVKCKEKIFFANIFFIYDILFLGVLYEKEKKYYYKKC